MTTTGTALLSNLGKILNDPDGDIWDSDLKVSFVNEALNMIALLRPDATAVTASLELTADTPKQVIPATGVRLLDVTRNIAGRPIRRITRELLNDSVPGWTIEETATAIEHFMFDAENPKGFFVYPMPSTTLSVEIIYSDTPATFTAASGNIGISETFLSPVMDYVLYRCLSMHTEGADFGRADGYLNALYTALGVKAKNDAALMQVQGA
ncbi:DUF6682 family protein [Desulfobacula sp.]|uniref:phage adaptor protein n=1 Tax=Desulfobacula sp. TaxID=2593537 RepID=UPI002620DFB3|nr:DUF6682 family protein [Desulfobacula sp.]